MMAYECKGPAGSLSLCGMLIDPLKRAVACQCLCRVAGPWTQKYTYRYAFLLVLSASITNEMQLLNNFIKNFAYLGSPKSLWRWGMLPAFWIFPVVLVLFTPCQTNWCFSNETVIDFEKKVVLNHMCIWKADRKIRNEEEKSCRFALKLFRLIPNCMGILHVVFAIVNKSEWKKQGHHCIWLITVSRMLSTDWR